MHKLWHTWISVMISAMLDALESGTQISSGAWVILLISCDSDALQNGTQFNDEPCCLHSLLLKERPTPSQGGPTAKKLELQWIWPPVSVVPVESLRMQSGRWSSWREAVCIHLSNVIGINALVYDNKCFAKHWFAASIWKIYREIQFWADCKWRSYLEPHVMQ